MHPVDLQRGHDEGCRLDVDSGAAREQAIGLLLEAARLCVAPMRVTDRAHGRRESPERCDGVADLAEHRAPAAVAGPRGCLQQRHAVLARQRHALAGLPGVAGGARRRAVQRGERGVLSLADARHQGEVLADGVFFPQPSQPLGALAEERSRGRQAAGAGSIARRRPQSARGREFAAWVIVSRNQAR